MLIIGQVLRHSGLALLLVAGLAGIVPTTSHAITLRVGVANLPPDIYLKPDGQAGGILGGILNEIAQREGWTLHTEACVWADCMRKLKAGDIDLLPDVTYTPERARVLSFHHKPVLLRWSQIYVRDGSSLNTIPELAGKHIAVLAGSAQYDYLNTLLSGLNIQAFLIPVDQLAQGFQLVQTGQADAVVAGLFAGEAAAKKYQLVSTPVIFQPAEVFYVAPLGRNPDVLMHIDQYLSAWQADPNSIYYDILSYWHGPPPKLQNPWYSHWILILLAIVLTASLLFAWRKRHQNHMLHERLQVNENFLAGTRGNMTEQAQIHEKIHHMAFYDTLTDLPNRPMLFSRIEQALQTAQTGEALGAVLVLDVDDFKKINEAQGLGAGDQVLQEIAQRLIANIPARDTVSRTDGNEFAVLLTLLGTEIEVSARKALKVAEKLRLALTENPLQIDGKPCVLRVSVGLTLLHSHTSTVNTVVQEAGMARHRAEQRGGNCVVFFTQDIQTELERHSGLEQDLIQAMHKPELQMYLQPQYGSDGRVTGAELLARWTHPVHGAISPTLFIPLAVGIGLITQLTCWALGVACETLLNLQRLGETYPISVNVNSRSLADHHFVQAIIDTLARTVAPTNHLILEITEEIGIENFDVAIRHMVELSKLGIRFSIDDFGTGYSNLASINTLPLYELKIDKSLVQNISDDSDNAIVLLVLGLAKQLNLRIVAEGVETQLQADFLFQHGCDALQGYLMARPMTIKKWIKDCPFRCIGLNTTG